MVDAVFYSFLENTYTEATALVQKSDVLKLFPIPPLPPAAYLCEFTLSYLRRLPSGVVEVASGPILAGVRFPEDYLRSTDHHLYLKVASILTFDFTHPNVNGSMVCLGSQFAGGSPITALLFELYDIVSYQNVTLDEGNALNPEACRLLREHRELLDGMERKPFMRRKTKLQVKVSEL
jgi:hypothetical protein